MIFPAACFLFLFLCYARFLILRLIDFLGFLSSLIFFGSSLISRGVRVCIN